jgi:hypothetical protein
MRHPNRLRPAATELLEISGAGRAGVRDVGIGFYWTLPVNWAGFRELPQDVEAAAEKSRTIRYQAERVRRWAKDNAVRLIDEIVYLDTRTDRATEGCRDALERARRRCKADGAFLLFVEFKQHNLWRYNPHIRSFSESLGFEPLGLSPDPLRIDGELFDPIRHFEQWRVRDQEGKAELRRRAEQGFAQALAEIPEGPGRYTAIADWLNEKGIRTRTGLRWTEENVRHVMKSRIAAAGAEASSTSLAQNSTSGSGSSADA